VEKIIYDEKLMEVPVIQQVTLYQTQFKEIDKHHIQDRLVEVPKEV
jgi:hypothetical protein